MPEHLSPPRRFQFRLRTLMIGVTLFAVPCAYVGWQAKIVHERKAMLQMVLASKGVYLTTAQIRETFSLANAGKDVSWIRKVLGDESVFCMYIPLSVPDAVSRRVVVAFPEVVIKRKEPVFGLRENSD